MLTQAGHTKHTCTSDGKALPFGRKAPRGECLRCDELSNGAAPRADHAHRRETPQTQSQRWAEIRAHRNTCHMCLTGGTCTAFDW